MNNSTWDQSDPKEIRRQNELLRLKVITEHPHPVLRDTVLSLDKIMRERGVDNATAYEIHRRQGGRG